MLMTTGKDDRGFGEKETESVEKAPAILKERMGNPRLPNSPKIENNIVGLRFQLKMLELMNFMNQEFKCGNNKRARQDKNYGILHDAKPY